MARAFFFTIGLFATLVGAECLIVDRAVLNLDRPVAQRQGFFPMVRGSVRPKREIEPPDWMGWSLISAGAVTMLYSITLPKKKD
jgi:hypothetical protein